MEESFINPVMEKKSVKKTWVIVALVVLIFAIGFSALVLFGTSRFVSNAAAAKQDMDVLQEQLAGLDFMGATLTARAAGEHLRAAHSAIRILAPLRLVPWIGRQVKATDELVLAGINAMEAMESMMDIATDIKSAIDEAQGILATLTVDDSSFSLETLPDEIRIEFINTLHQSADDLLQVQAKLKLAESHLTELFMLGNVHPNILAVAEPMNEMLSELIGSVDLLIPIAQTVDELAGIGETKQWLILFLNNTELRPGGGFIGVYGLVQVTDGEINDIFTSDSYAVDKLVEKTSYQAAAPAPIVEYLGVDNWYFRDANWSPDFAQSAQAAIALLRQEIAYTGSPVPEIAGVIGLTPTVAEEVLKITGPIETRGITFTNENITEQLEYYVEYGYADVGSTWNERKTIVGDLATVVLNRFIQTPFEQWGEIMNLTREMINQKQLLAYSENQETQQVFAERAWGGVVNPSTPDVLMLVDANMGALKTDHAIARELSYTVTPQDNDLFATVGVNYKHEGEFDWRTTRYLDYVRVYAPLGSTLTAVSLNDQGIAVSEVDVESDLGMTSFGLYITIEPGEVAALSFVYTLPEIVKTAVAQGLYELAVIKQPGSAIIPLTLALDFGTTVRVAQPSESPEEYGDSLYVQETSLMQDLLFIVQF